MFHRWLLAPSQIRRIFADGASCDVRVVVSLLLLFVGGGGQNLFDIYALCVLFLPRCIEGADIALISL